uniref:C2H2-type domain-containing protein n=1 Tax=Daucus carota subsp. sativus TaxID=79200 RepID=A0A161ZUY9_DAUCS
MKNKEKITANSIVNHQSNPHVNFKKISYRRGRYSSDYTCTHCFRTFTSAQSLGGYLKAHQAEKKEEKRLHVKNHLSYRKQLFLRSLDPNGVSSVSDLPPTLHVQGPPEAISAGNDGNETKPKSLLSFDLNLPAATGSDDELDVEK